ncbi:hypothetical protein LRF89_10800 [Halorhodospira sp. 9621]|uniref:hypothetical protein n=1 Tax=Halorhodospira sp. 9621 TaxID=2899135 RepID=UPI001EE86F82|nr:hypothetical protein [Halorhodospira sp. 9621]MCG5533925.1 hypothetical protein [Halorhodospira sp. 9621]
MEENGITSSTELESHCAHWSGEIHHGCQAVTDALRSPEELEHTATHVLQRLEGRGYRLQQRIAAHRGSETLDAYGASASYLIEAAAILQGTVAVLRSLHESISENHSLCEPVRRQAVAALRTATQRLQALEATVEGVRILLLEHDADRMPAMNHDAANLTRQVMARLGQ